MHRRLWRRGVFAIGIAVAAFAVVAGTATADQYFHTVHVDLTPIGGAPLKSGFVNDIHTNGATISAQERYQLVGAEPDTTYSVMLQIASDPNCTTVTRTVAMP